MKLRHPLSRRDKFLILALVPAYFVLAGLLMQPVNEIGSGLLAIIREPDFLITDYFVIGGVGASFLNAGLLTLVSIGIVYSLGMEMDGHTITSALLMFGFSLFGKNVLNIWSILFGVFLYAKYHKTSVSRYIYIGFYGTSLSPIITQVMQIEGIPAAMGFLLSLCLGIIIGFVLPPLCTHVHYAHKGYSLYNVGFAGGIIATVVVSLFKSFGLDIQSRLIWSSGRNREFFVLLTVLFVGMMVIGLAASPNRTWKAYREILKTNGISGTDYVKSEGLAPTLLNMGINGLFATILVVAVGGGFKRSDYRRHFHHCRLQFHGKAPAKYRPSDAGRLSCQPGKILESDRPVPHAGLAVIHHPGAHRRRVRLPGRNPGRISSLLRGPQRGNRLRRHESLQQRVRRRYRGHLPGAAHPVHPGPQGQSQRRTVSVISWNVIM